MILATTVQAFITDLDSKYANAFSNADKLSWINEIELNDYADVVRNYLAAYYSRTANVNEISFPSGVSFNDIRKVYVNGTRYKKMDLRADKQYYSFYEENSKIKIYPAPSETDTSYVSDAGEITFASGSITTTGDDFSGFSVGDVIQVSGATTSANNRYATVTGVTDTVLSFATGTFSAGLDAAAVTISLPKIKVVYQNMPTEKLIANIATDTLLMPDRFKNVYTFYCMAQIALLNRELGEYNNYITLYKARFAEFVAWWENVRPTSPDDEICAKEDGEDYYETNDFDYE